MTEQNQDALRCAEKLTARSLQQKLDQLDNDAAAHIRRLVEETDTLRDDLRKFREAASCERDLRRQQERHATALVQQMLDALESLFGIPDQWTGAGGGGVAMWRGNGADAPRAAITAAREWLEKGGAA